MQYAVATRLGHADFCLACMGRPHAPTPCAWLLALCLLDCNCPSGPRIVRSQNSKTWQKVLEFFTPCLSTFRIKSRAAGRDMVSHPNVASSRRLPPGPTAWSVVAGSRGLMMRAVPRARCQNVLRSTVRAVRRDDAYPPTIIWLIGCVAIMQIMRAVRRCVQAGWRQE